MSDTNQLDLFFETEDKPQFLYILKDAQPVTMTVEQIFDPVQFTEITAITFVSSPKFFFETTKDFQMITLVLGIEDNDVLRKFNHDPEPVIDNLQNLLNPGRQLEFWKDCPLETKEKIRTGAIKVLYTKINYAIHSKIYLLKGPRHTRLIIGSANFTKMAFQGKKQFEELMIFDNSPLFDIYQERVKQIISFTQDYIPERIKHQKPDQPIFVNDPEMLKDILLDNVNKNRKELLLPEALYEQLKSTHVQLNDEQKEANITVTLLDTVFKKKRNAPEFELLTKKQLEEKKQAIRVAYTKPSKGVELVDPRSTLYFSDTNNYLYRAGTNIDIINDDSSSLNLTLFSKQQDQATIQESLSLIVQFIEAYRIFTVNKDLRTQKGIFEAILYAFAAPFLWKFRDDYAREHGENGRSSFKPFLILAGRAFSGKTTLLEFISGLLGASQYIPYPKVKAKGVLLSLFKSENVSPLLLDEVDNNFFTSTKPFLGEGLIKHVANDLTGKHPVMIGTTNASGFHASQQIKRRIYYLEVTNAFNQSQESKEHLDKIMNQVTPALFQDFAYRMGEFLKVETSHSASDFLYAPRRIFTDYFKEAGLELPEWFSHTTCDDYRERARMVWQNLHINNREHFKIQDQHTLFVDIAKFSHSDREREGQINLLPPECIKEDSHGVLLLNKNSFYEFILQPATIMDKIKAIFRT